LVQSADVTAESMLDAADDSLTVLNLMAKADASKFEGAMLVNQDTAYTFPSRVWQGVPSVTVARNGYIYAAWYSGTAKEGPGNYVIVQVSTDKGLTWKENALIVSPTNSKVRFFDPSLWTDENGNVLLCWTKCKDKLWDGIGGVWYSQIKYSGSKMMYSTPRRIADGVMLNKPAESNDGTQTLYPISVWRINVAGKVNDSGINIFRSFYDDVAKKPGPLTEVGTIPASNSLLTYNEHQIVQLKDDSYYVLIRGVDGIYQTTSKDLSNWAPVTKFTGIPATTSSRFFVGRLASGKLALVINNATTRTNLTIYLSDDEGKTWGNPMLIDSGNPVTYPDLAQGRDGKIYVIYDFDRFGKKNIKMVSFTEADILNNATQNIKRTLISGL
jgi:Neuraminidase (sialidase)